MAQSPIKLTCPRESCGYVWSPRKRGLDPVKECPRCKARLDR